MKRLWMIGLPMMVAATVSIGSVEGQEEKTALTQFMNDYVSAFGSLDPQRVLLYYHEPLTLVTASRVVVMASRADIEASLLKPLYARLKDAGWDGRSTWAQMHVKQVAAGLAVASGLTIRHKLGGQELERVGATYTLRKTNDGWKIVTLTAHDPGSVLRLE